MTKTSMWWALSLISMITLAVVANQITSGSESWSIDTVVIDADSVAVLPYVRDYAIGEHNGYENESFYQPHVAVAASGEIYVSDLRNDRIIQFSNQGAFLKKTGKAGQRAGDFLFPYCITVGNDGNIYTLETINKRVKRYTPSLILTNVIQPSPFIASHFVVDQKGCMYFWSSERENLVTVTDLEGNIVRKIPKPMDLREYEARAGNLHLEIAVDKADMIHVGYAFPEACQIDSYDARRRTIKRVLIRAIERGVPLRPITGLAYVCGQDNCLYLLLQPLNLIYKFTPDGTCLGRINLVEPNHSVRHFYVSLAVDRDGRIVSADQATDQIVRFSPKRD